jgi:hypothetical protein
MAAVCWPGDPVPKGNNATIRVQFAFSMTKTAPDFVGVLTGHEASIHSLKKGNLSHPFHGINRVSYRLSCKGQTMKQILKHGKGDDRTAPG